MRFFGGVPLSVKIDNLKAGVVQADFYDPIIQQQYAQFLAHYQCQPITARVRRPQDKGKVESAVKYVKINFLKGQTATGFTDLQQQLSHWMLQVCNQRVHGTTRRVPAHVMAQTEQGSLQPLPLSAGSTTRSRSARSTRWAMCCFAITTTPYQPLTPGK